MARNKYPEETVARILDVSMRLFLEKGYDHTTIQDIVDHLNGLTKGAVYHHFKSKEDILTGAIDRESAGLIQQLDAIRDDPAMTGLEKLQALFEASATGSQLSMSAAMGIAPDPVRNSLLLGLQYQSIFQEAAPLYVEPIVRQGMEDGTIQTDHPREMAEVMLMLSNLWVNPMFRVSSADDMAQRVQYYMLLLQRMGANLVDVGISDQLERYRASCEAGLERRGED